MYREWRKEDRVLASGLVQFEGVEIASCRHYADGLVSARVPDFAYKYLVSGRSRRMENEMKGGRAAKTGSFMLKDILQKRKKERKKVTHTKRIYAMRVLN